MNTHPTTDSTIQPIAARRPIAAKVKRRVLMSLTVQGITAKPIGGSNKKEIENYLTDDSPWQV
jgi:hypothetical protein